MESQPQNHEFRISPENFHQRKFIYHAFQKANNKGTDQTLQTCSWFVPLLFACNKVRFSHNKAAIWDSAQNFRTEGICSNASNDISSEDQSKK